MRIISYKDKVILERAEDTVFVLNCTAEQLKESRNLKLKGCKICESVESAKDYIDFGDADEYKLPNVVYQVIINPGAEDEEIQELTDLNLAQELFDGLKVNPADHYKMIKLVKFNYEEDAEEILDFEDYEGSTRIPESIKESIDDSALSDEYQVLSQLSSIVSVAKRCYEKYNETKHVDLIDVAIINISKCISNLDALKSKLS